MFQDLLEIQNYNFFKIFHISFQQGNKKPNSMYILIKITGCQDLVPVVPIFLKNQYTDFDETLHVVWVCSGQGFGTIGTSGPNQKKGDQPPEAALALRPTKRAEIQFAN